MNRHVLTRYLWAIILAGLLPANDMWGLTVWNGPVLASVTDDDITITGNVSFATPGNHLFVHATVAHPVLVITINSGNILFTANDLPGQPVGFDLIADPGCTIFFQVQNSIDFRGDNETFLMTASGGGRILFGIERNEHLAFTSAQPAGPGTYFLVSMDQTNPNMVTFQPYSFGNNDATVVIDPRSLIGCVGNDTTLQTQSATIRFNAINQLTDTGRFVLQVNDLGSMAVQGYNLPNMTIPYNLSAVDFTTLAGARVNFEVNNGGVPVTSFWAGLRVSNNNRTMPLLRANPWFESLAVGVQPGFVVGLNGAIQVDDGAYLDYEAGELNIDPTPNVALSILVYKTVNGVQPPVNTLVKRRNPSALIFDSTMDIFNTDFYPEVVMLGTSKIYLRSTRNASPQIVQRFTPGDSGLVDPHYQFVREDGYGCIVWDVEGLLDVNGVTAAPNETNAINILSIEEAVTGGSVMIGGTDINFKLRTFNKDPDGVLFQYGKACMMINGRMDMTNVALQHDDEIHKVFEKNIGEQSEPCYIGGETFNLVIPDLISYTIPRPTIALYNAEFLVQTGAALTGVDFLTPSYMIGVEEALDNNSNFVFFQNGYAIDYGTGRNLVLGTNWGATAVDKNTIVSRDAHFNVWQEYAHPTTSIQANILTASNNAKVTEGISGDISTQYSDHSFFLGHGSNVSLGINATQGTEPSGQHQSFTITSYGTMNIAGDFMSFETQGGYLNDPMASIIEGQGGIFVDNYGYLLLPAAYRASFATMIGLGAFANSIIDIGSDLAGRAYFKNGVGISNSTLDLNTLIPPVIISPSTNLSDFTLDWKYTQRNSGYIPYPLPTTPSAGNLPPVTAANLTGIPIVQGQVGQFQIRDSRLGDMATVLFDGTYTNGDAFNAREVVFLNSEASGMSPVAVLVLQANAKIGLGCASKNADSPEAGLTLGVNGVTLLADGPAQVLLNQNVLVNNACHIITGPNFGATEEDELFIYSPVDQEIRVKFGGTIDFSQFKTSNQRVVIGGKVRLVFEPGSRLILGGGELVVTDDASIVFEPYISENRAAGTSLSSTDDIRVKINGTGTIRFKENGVMQLYRGGLVGIESGGDDNIGYVTNINLMFRDATQLQIGTTEDYGGALQVGNVTDLSGLGGTVNFTLTLTGLDARAIIASQGFLGLGAGIVDKGEVAPNSWRVAPTYNVNSITLDLTQGIFDHNQIYTGTDTYASLLCFGTVGAGGVTVLYPSVVDINLLGGGNMFRSTTAGAYELPVVTTIDSATTGILASKATLLDSSKTAPAFPATPATVFNWLKANTYEAQVTKRAQLSQNTLGTLALGYVLTGVPNNTIVRYIVEHLIGYSGTYADPSRSLEFGSSVVALSSANVPTAFAVYQ